MGIGAAFATGLVRGFTQNIQQEKARRLSEKERVDGIENLVLKSYLSGETTRERFNSVTNLIKESRKEYKDRTGKIDIFGRASDGIDLDFAKLQGSLNDVGSESTIEIGSYNLVMSDSLTERYQKDRANPAKEATLIIQALNEDVTSNKSVFEKNFVGNADNLNALRMRYVPAINAVLAERRKNNTGAVLDPRTQIPNYQYFSDLLSLGIDQEANLAMDAVINAEASQTNKSKNNYVGVSGTLTGGNIGSYNALDIEMFTNRNIDMSIIDQIANSQGRTRNVFMANFSSQYNTTTDFFNGLKHAQAIQQIKMDTKGDFTSPDTLIAIGDYLDNPANGISSNEQLNLIRGIQGPLLSLSEREALSRGTMTEDNFRLGTNIEEGYKAVFGNDRSFSEFKTRVESARKAKEQLLEYREIIDGTRTVKDTILDKTLKIINSMFGPTGSVDQVMGLLGRDFENDTEEAAIRARLEGIKASAGDNDQRARRDTLAFIIAANMARAEDQAGRLSDGDILRNLQKLSPGMATKKGERLSVDQVIESVDSQLRQYQEIESLVDQRGMRGFDLTTQRKIKALKIRDDALRQSRLARMEATLGARQAPIVTFAEVKDKSDSELFESTIPNRRIIDMGDGTLVVVEGETIIAQGKPGSLVDNLKRPLITQRQSGQGGTLPQPTSQTTSQPTPTTAKITVESINLQSPMKLGSNGYSSADYPGKIFKKIIEDGKDMYVEIGATPNVD